MWLERITSSYAHLHIIVCWQVISSVIGTWCFCRFQRKCLLDTKIFHSNFIWKRTIWKALPLHAEMVHRAFLPNVCTQRSVCRTEWPLLDNYPVLASLSWQVFCCSFKWRLWTNINTFAFGGTDNYPLTLLFFPFQLAVSIMGTPSMAVTQFKLHHRFSSFSSSKLPCLWGKGVHKSNKDLNSCHF